MKVADNHKCFYTNILKEEACHNHERVIILVPVAIAAQWRVTIQRLVQLGVIVCIILLLPLVKSANKQQSILEND